MLCACMAGTLFWLLTSNSYPDYDGYTVYTSRVAASEPRPAWPSLTPELFEAVWMPFELANPLHMCAKCCSPC